MQFGIGDFLTLLGALGFFIYGMKIMSEGIQKAAGSKLRLILRTMTKNRVFGVITGFIVTSLVQSSSATTVMTVSFVNAGLLSLVESAGIMMGANVGTTLTAWLVSYFGFKFKIVSLALPIIAIGLPLLFSKKSNYKSWGEFMIGFALLFMGLNELKMAVPDLEGNEQVLSFLAEYADLGFFSMLLFIGVGALLTIIIQSSSAAMTLTLVMCNNGWIPFEIATAMVLGENIGTTITAELASLVGNVHAKRSARIHSMFNIIGVTWMVIAMPFFLELITWFTTEIMGNQSPYESSKAVPFALSYFHTAFNLTNVLLLIGFVPFLVNVAVKTVKAKSDADEEFKLEYIGSGLMGTPELSILEASKEIRKFGEIIDKMTNLVEELITADSEKRIRKLYKKIKNYEDNTDQMEREIANYLSKISEQELSNRSSQKIISMLSIINDLERIGDIYQQISKVIENSYKEKAKFSNAQKENLISMFKVGRVAIDHMLSTLSSQREEGFLVKAQSLEDDVNKKRDELRTQHLKQLEKRVYTISTGHYYADIYSSVEKIGDHVINVAEAVAEYAKVPGT